MGLEIFNGYTPHSGQGLFHASNAKYRAIISGIGYGKTTCGANEIIRMAMTHGRTPDGDSILYLILAPTSKMMQTSTLIQFFKWCPREIIAGRKRNEHLIFLTSGATIVYLTADNQRHIERLRGMELGGFWADEASMLLYTVWRILLGRLRAQGAPLKGIITTTPRGKNWLHYYFMRKVHPKTKEALDASKYEWFGGSTLENPHTPQEYKDDLLSNYKGKFAEQEIYGKIVSFEGMVYDNFNESIHVIDYQPKNLHRFIIGVDWGFTNPMGGLIIGLDGDDRYYILEEFYRKKAYPEKLGEWIIKMYKKYPKLEDATAYADPSEPGNILKLHEMGIYVVGANNAVMPGIQDVYTQFEISDDKKPRLFIHMRCYNFLEEISQYRYEDAKEGKENRDVPLKVEDHLMDCARYALHSHMRISGSITPLEDPENILGLA